MASPCFGGERKLYKWKIEGFSSLLNLEATSHKSTTFEAGGHEWELCIDMSTTGDGKKWISLYLYLADASFLSSDEVVKAIFKLRIYNRLHSKHIEGKATFNFQSTFDNVGVPHMIPLDTFKDRLSGFLVNDSCIFAVEFIELRARTLDSKGVVECMSLHKEKISHTMKWKIENFKDSKRPYICSEVFSVGDINWHLKLYPDGIGKVNHLSIFLELDDPIAIPQMFKVYVDFTLCVIDQSDKHRKHNAQHIFSSKASLKGWREFLSLEDLNNSSNKFLVDNACTIEASINILGPIKVQ